MKDAKSHLTKLIGQVCELLDAAKPSITEECRMAMILKFVPKPLPLKDAAGTDGVTGETGEVVIFPGIRVERNEFRLSDRIEKDGPATTPGKRRRPKRSGK